MSTQKEQVDLLNNSFKSSFFKETILNSALLISFFIFFFILIDSTKAFILGVYEFNWKTIFLTLLDLGFSLFISYSLYVIKKHFNNKDSFFHFNETLSIGEIKTTCNQFIKTNREKVSNYFTICFLPLAGSFLAYNILFYSSDYFFSSFSVLNDFYLKYCFNYFPFFPLQTLFILYFSAFFIQLLNLIIHISKNSIQYWIYMKVFIKI